MTVNGKKVWGAFKEYLLITVGILSYVLGWTIFLVPNNLVGGGELPGQIKHGIGEIPRPDEPIPLVQKSLICQGKITLSKAQLFHAVLDG
jgi:hypothetical protein